MIIGVGILLAAFVSVLIITATPLVGEVVTVHTHGADGEWETTPLWIVDLDNTSYLRAGTPEGSGWFTRLQANPDVRLERAGELHRCAASGGTGAAASSPSQDGGEVRLG